MNAEKKNFYGWILLVAIGIMFLCSSGFILVGASVVNPLMMADSSMNMNATLMGLGFTLFVLCQGIPAPLIGQFITKYGQKKTFIVGGLLLIIGGLLMAFVVKTTIGYLIAFGVILSIGSQMAGQVTMQTSVSAWFVQKRALAMSIATVIGAIGSFISPRILNSIVASTGRWQNAWLLVAGLGVVVIIIAVALVVDKPSDKGQYPDGIEPGSAVAAAQKFSKVYKTSEAYESLAYLSANVDVYSLFGLKNGRTGNHMFNSAPYGLFEGAGKRYIAICAPTPPIWKNLCIAMQREDLLENERYSDMSKRIENRYELVDIIQAWLSKYENASEAIEILRSHDVPCAEVKADWEMHECPQLASRHYFEDIPFPKSIVEETGRKQYKIKGLPFKTSSDAENPDYLPLPEVGEHNYDVYGTVATKEEIDALLDRWHNKFHKY